MTIKKRTLKGNSSIVSIRLPKPILEKLDAEVERLDTSRTDIIRAGLALYHASQHSVMVPINASSRSKLIQIAKAKQLPVQTVASEFVEHGIQRASAHRIWFSVTLYPSRNMEVSKQRPSEANFEWVKSEVAYAQI